MYLIFPLISMALAAIVLVLALVFNFIIAPLRTLAMILQKIAGIIGVLFTAWPCTSISSSIWPSRSRCMPSSGCASPWAS